MIEKVIEFSLKHRFIIIVASLIVGVIGVWSIKNTPIDAIPDLSENQVIVMTEWMGRSPELVEKQITYPLQSSLRGLPKVKAVRGQTMFGLSMIYVIFEDDVDIYWARTRVSERLAQLASTVPQDSKTMLGPDGTGVGHVYWYTVEGDGYDLGTLRTIQDWYIKPILSSVSGVAEVASIGGFVKQYQVLLYPDKLLYYNIDGMMVLDAIRQSNMDVGGGLIEQSSMEYMIRGFGYIQNKSELENLSVMTTPTGATIRLKDIADIQVGGSPRRGLLDKNGKGEVVGGIVVMRYGENARDVIRRVKERIQQLSNGLPKGVYIYPAYDRSELIESAIHTLTKSLIEEMIIVSVIVFLFLLHFRSALAVIVTLPLSVVSAFIAMNAASLTSNLMSLAGIAIAIGVMVDAAIILVENAYRHLSNATEEQRKQSLQIIYHSCKTVGKPIFFSLAIIVISFIPVFLLEGQEGKLFHPLAFTKTFSMLGAAIFAITLIPVLSSLLLKGNLKKDTESIFNRFLYQFYQPILRWCLKHPWTTLFINGVVLAFTCMLFFSMGTEFMPSLDEGSLLFMPTTLPNASIQEIKRIMQLQDEIILSVPEVKSVLGKAGRAETATDPAPLSMIETIILLKPQKEWRKGITKSDIIAELDAKLQIPGVTNGWTQPIINRINMLATGIRTDVGLKIYGTDLNTLEQLAIEAEQMIKQIPGASDVIAERLSGGNSIDVYPKRELIAWYGFTMQEILSAIEFATNGMTATEILENRERYSVIVKFHKDYRDALEQIQRIPLVSKTGTRVLLGDIADVKLRESVSMITTENAQFKSTVYVNVRDRDLVSFVKEAQSAIQSKLRLPQGYFVEWSGQWENHVRAQKRLLFILPIVLILIFVMLYFIFEDLLEASLVMLSVPFSLTGGAILLYLMNYNLSVAVWVGFIGLYGIAVETGVVMVVYLHEALNQTISKGEITLTKLYEAIEAGSVLRLRPKLMTVGTSMLGLLPILWSTGIGADVLKPIATPMIGGLLTSAIHVLLVTPILFAIIKERELKKKGTLHRTKIGW
ncbi:MAG: CusA/CzcA family heavy metal efflux RND transporter [bacterium]|nr:CusA/CzcA family heavy metal efflux RND transporter [bacterium]